MATLPLLIILNRFPTELAVQEYVERYSKVALSMLMHVETKDLMARRKKLDPTNEQVKNDAENVIIRRTLVLELLGKIIHLGHASYARKILPLLRALDKQYTTMVGESMPTQEENGGEQSKDIGAQKNSDLLGPRRHPGIVSLIRFCGVTLQAAQEDTLGFGNDGGGGGGRGGKLRRRGNSRGGGGSRRNRKQGDSKRAGEEEDDDEEDGPEPDFESELLRKGEARKEARAAEKKKKKMGKSGRKSRERTNSRGGGSRESFSREKPRSAGNDAINLQGGRGANFEGFESFAMEGVTQLLEPEEEEEEESDHPFDEVPHESDDEETKVSLLYFSIFFIFVGC